jgi:cytochrome c oxidase assembly protein subunit 15
VRRLGLVALIAVIAQGLLGGLTVKMMLPLAVSSAHATLAQLFFCTMVSLSVFTSPGWKEPRESLEEKGNVSLRYLAVAAAASILIQLVLGATLRHSATWDQYLPTSLLLTHLGGALTVLVVLGSTVFTTIRRYAGETYLTRPARFAATLLIVQLSLGVAAYLTRLASPNSPQPRNPMVGITVAHVACGALVFATTIVLALRAFRVLSGERANASGYQRLSAELN